MLNLENNRIDNMSSFNSLKNIQLLRLDNNRLENLNSLSALKNLTRLTVSSNNLTSLDGLENFRMLRYLNVSNNKLKGKLDFSNYDLWLLEDLLLNGNKLTSVSGLELLPDLIYFSADQNNLSSLNCGDVNNSIKKLSLVMNNFKTLDLSNYPKLKELRADKNHLESITGLTEEVEKVSLKYQSKPSAANTIISHSSKASRMRKLALTGGVLDLSTIKAKSSFSSVSQLVLCAMNLESLPSNFCKVFPMLLDLNLNFNKLTTLEGLEGLTYLRQLKVLSNNLKTIESIVMHTQSCRNSLKLIDLRVNPLTKSIYPYVFYDTREKEDDETDGSDDTNEFDEGTTLNLKDYDDIEAFSIEYTKLYTEEGLQTWKDKNWMLLEANSTSEDFIKLRAKYEMSMIVWFSNIVYLDGLKIDSGRRAAEKKQWRKLRKGRK
ncbi:unnamed protein product [Ambrosiozyma monospora]|uniref:Unnamed protein product n=1 Tax=Ambrosiozyma monospora TaxID=43982 RepID=A0ACB5TBH9_AMBMO|nr:unnamed protein product [Ambrosiozyma monospora]